MLPYEDSELATTESVASQQTVNLLEADKMHEPSQEMEVEDNLTEPQTEKPSGEEVSCEM